MMSEETRNNLESQANSLNEKISKLIPGSKEHSAAVTDYCNLMKALNDIDRNEIETFKTNETLRLEDEKNQANAEVEKRKSGLTPGKAVIELLKVIVPAATTVLSFIAYDRYQTKNLEFESEHVFKAQTTKDLRGSNMIRK